MEGAKARKRIRTLTANQAAKRLRDAGLGMATLTLEAGLEQGVYPFGVCILAGKQRVFQISAKKLEEWIDDWGSEEEEE